ncbi:MAG: imidazolonepropionase [Gammaproteobacteria bacterium]|nr:MAG: imidazolonepropionase [Gammaproteobacteria bacterium]
MKTTISILFLSILAAAVEASENIPPPPQGEPVIIRGATLHTVSGEVIENGHLSFEDGRITAIGANDGSPVSADINVIDLSGKHIYPGLIAANTVLGLVEINAVRATRDYAEPGTINPNVKANEAVDPDSELFPVARANGILVALSVPQSPGNSQTGATGLITGSSAVLQMDGWTWEDMTVKSPAGVHVIWPEIRSVPPDDKEAQKALGARLKALNDAFAEAHSYSQAHAAGSLTKTDLRWEAMLPVFAGDIPVFVHANDVRQIRGALELAGKFDVKLVIVGGIDAWRVADELKAADAAVIVSPVHTVPLRRWEPYDTPFTNASKLAAAGVRFAIAGDGSAFGSANARNVPYNAATAAAHGLSRDDALKAITLYAAEILGVDNRLGSLEAGKDATFIVTDGDPLEITTNVERAWIQGREIDLSSHHTRLYEKYQEKYRQLETE